MKKQPSLLWILFSYIIFNCSNKGNGSCFEIVENSSMKSVMADLVNGNNPKENLEKFSSDTLFDKYKYSFDDLLDNKWLFNNFIIIDKFFGFWQRDIEQVGLSLPVPLEGQSLL